MVILGIWPKPPINTAFKSKSTSPVPPPAEETSSSTSEASRCLIRHGWAKLEKVFAQTVGNTFSNIWLQIDGNKKKVTEFINDGKKQSLIINNLYVNPLVGRGKTLSLNNNRVILEKDPESKNILWLNMEVKENSMSKESQSPKFHYEQSQISIDTVVDSKISES
jgi:hypothetical protein